MGREVKIGVSVIAGLLLVLGIVLYHRLRSATEARHPVVRHDDLAPPANDDAHQPAPLAKHPQAGGASSDRYRDGQTPEHADHAVIATSGIEQLPEDEAEPRLATQPAQPENLAPTAVELAPTAVEEEKQFAPADSRVRPSEGGASQETVEPPGAEMRLEPEPAPASPSDPNTFDAGAQAAPDPFADRRGEAERVLQEADSHAEIPPAADLRLESAQPAQHVEGPSEAPSGRKPLLQRLEEKAEWAEHEAAERLSGAAHRLKEGAVRAEEAVSERVSGAAHRLAEEAHQLYESAAQPHESQREHPRDEHEAEHRHRLGEHYTVEPNDNFWVISKKLYGTAAYFKALYEHNRRDFPRADQLRTGDVISTPEVAVLRQTYPDLCPRPDHERPAAALHHAVSGSRHLPHGGRVYVVEEGDTLFDIARYELGKASRWVDIYDMNRHTLGDNFDYLTPGLELVLPSGESSDPVTGVPSQTLRR